jgi:hypothetical protein
MLCIKRDSLNFPHLRKFHFCHVGIIGDLTIKYKYEMIFYHGTTSLVCQGILIIEDSWSHSDTLLLVELFWTSDQPVAETSTWKYTTLTETEILATHVIWIHNPSKRAGAYSPHRPRDHWDRLIRYFLYFFAATAIGPPHSRGSRLHTATQHSPVVLLWTSDQPVAETSIWQHTTLTRDRHPCPRWDSKPQSQQASGRRPTP